MNEALWASSSDPLREATVSWSTLLWSWVADRASPWGGGGGSLGRRLRLGHCSSKEHEEFSLTFFLVMETENKPVWLKTVPIINVSPYWCKWASKVDMSINHQTRQEEKREVRFQNSIEWRSIKSERAPVSFYVLISFTPVSFFSLLV